MRATPSSNDSEQEVLEQIKERVRSEAHRIMHDFQGAADIVPEGSEANPQVLRPPSDSPARPLLPLHPTAPSTSPWDMPGTTKW